MAVIGAALVLSACRTVGAIGLVQEHYRWRNDDGSESAATWSSPPDMPYQKMVAGERVRLRFALSGRESQEAVSGVRARLEYAVHSPHTFLQVHAVATNAPFELAGTCFYSSGAPTTDLIPGSGTFIPGVCIAAPDVESMPFDVAVDAFTNIEYCFRATEHAVGGATYFFRVSDAGDALLAYDVYAGVLVVGKPEVGNANGASAVTDRSAVLHGRVLEMRGDVPVVRVFWGAEDGGDVFAAWSHVFNLGPQPYAFHLALTNIAANETIHYRCHASNIAGAAWAPSSESFTTCGPTLQFESNAYVVAETVTSITAIVSLARPSASKTVSVDYETVDGSAQSGRDYTSVTGALAWAVGEIGGRSIVIPLQDDGEDERDEVFHLRFHSPRHGFLPGGDIDVAIADDDGFPTVRFATSTSDGLEADTIAALEVVLEPAGWLDAQVDFAIGGGSASPGEDFSLTSGQIVFPAGVTRTNITLTIHDDTVYEPPETAVIKLFGATNAMLGIATSHTYTIRDVDPRPPIMDNWKGAATISSAGATLRGQVVDTGRDDPAISIHWGAVDGGTHAGAWHHVIDLGRMGVATFCGGISNLVPGTLYYYRVCGSNAAGVGWAPASENLIALDPPTFLLLTNASLEIGAPGNEACPENWTTISDADMVRVNAFARTGSYSVRVPSFAGSLLFGAGRNVFRTSWNGQYVDGSPHTAGGVRPGYILSGFAHVRAATIALDPCRFTFGWWNIDRGENWMSNHIATSETVYREIHAGNACPVPLCDVGNRCVPVFRRDSVGTADIGIFHVDDITVTVQLPRLHLETDPAEPVHFPVTLPELASERRLGVRSQGGGAGTVLYGAFVRDPTQLTDAARDATAWEMVFDPSNAFRIVSGEQLVATNDAGYQYATIHFEPRVPGTYTGVVRIATTDPVDRYPGGGKLHDSVVYEQYLLVGHAVPPPALCCENVTVREGNCGLAKAEFLFNLTTPVIAAVTFDYGTRSGTALAGDDFVPVTGHTVIPVGQQRAVVEVWVVGDQAREGDETFSLAISNVSNATMAVMMRTCCIRDDESTLLIIR